MDKKILTGIIASLGASLCCITPVLAVLAGSAGLASTFSWLDPFRPYFIGLTVLVLAYVWWEKLKLAAQPVTDPLEQSAKTGLADSFPASFGLVKLAVLQQASPPRFPTGSKVNMLLSPHNLPDGKN